MSSTASGTPSAPAHSRPVPIAPAPTVNGQPTPHDPENAQSSMPYTCITCARRKVKCDKIAPTCSTCRKARLDCEYQEPAPRKRKRKPVDDVHERLQHYEALLKQNGILPGDGSATISPAESAPGNSSYTTETRSVTESGNPFFMGMEKTRPASETAPGKLLRGHDKTRYIDSNIWRNLGDDDFHPSSDEEEDAETQPVSGNQPTFTADPVSAALLGPGSPSSSLIDLHPTYESAMKLWSMYVENIDPIVKIVHVPSGLTMLQRAAANPSSASKATEALLFAIYHFAVVSISESECQKQFGELQSKLLARYHDAVRQALVNAYFLRSTNFTLVQAFVLFLLSVRNRYDPSTFWILTGVAVRIAQRMGLHRDGNELGLKPFDVEMRRRLFWQILPLDGLAGQLSGTGICITPDSWDVRQPLNVNDTDIWPGMADPPEPRTGATDIIFCLARTEIAKFVQRTNPPVSNVAGSLDSWEATDVAEKEKLLNKIEDEMETKYVRYCDFVNPLHTLTMGMCRAAINGGRFRIRLPRVKATKDVPVEERREAWAIANKIIDIDIAARSNVGLHKFMWHIHALGLWDPIVWILNEIRRDPFAHQDEQIWSKIEMVHSYHPELSAPQRSMHVAIGQLTLKSWDAYQSSMRRENQTAQQEPSFIESLRSLSNKRKGSKVTSSSHPTPDYNPFNPVPNELDDFSAPDSANSAWNTGYIDFNPLADSLNTDSMDWMFWDQLIHDPNSFPAT